MPDAVNVRKVSNGRLGLAITLKGDDGAEVTPGGSPLTVKDTVPRKPFRLVAVRIADGDVLPGETEILDGEIERLKSPELTATDRGNPADVLVK